ncbi:cyclase family protein [Rossellomorea marisflavi]|uniref:Kynurenine formamidase n=1 Tax=Rossellomorea marisflavi TaxID=189381 RepID=A0A5D4RZD3_9BACI|nr:cyclase family protein [Rossellomorea marisflavi]KQU59693.1 cyclase [Bacillus sp. Leaf406]MBV6683705.1 cyclase family protein [Bacillus sp. JRC01]MDW4527255.1 cyclase family protein [Rossellomorea marisflavi]TYS56687.1 cyclase family protein [Rossellomorea marisflavi]UKS63938.1 cyclase family protein [Rossellomorea marisflavi]
MKIYDVTAPIHSDMPVYKNKPEKKPSIKTDTNGHVTESRISIDLHTGTHVDAPLHMFNEGETIETIDIKQLVRPVKVFDLTDAEENISYEDIKDLAIEENDFVIFKTKNSWDEEFNFEFIYVAADAAKHLAEKKIAGVAIDALGIERAQEGHPTHRTLMGNGVIIMEGLRLKDIEAGQYFMVAAPLNVQKTDASPARVLLFDEMIG